MDLLVTGSMANHFTSTVTCRRCSGEPNNPQNLTQQRATKYREGKLKQSLSYTRFGRRFHRQRDEGSRKDNSMFGRERTRNQNHSLENGGSTESRYKATVTRRTTAAMGHKPSNPRASVNYETIMHWIRFPEYYIFSKRGQDSTTQPQIYPFSEGHVLQFLHGNILSFVCSLQRGLNYNDIPIIRNQFTNQQHRVLC